MIPKGKCDDSLVLKRDRERSRNNETNLFYSQEFYRAQCWGASSYELVRLCLFLRGFRNSAGAKPSDVVFAA